MSKQVGVVGVRGALEWALGVQGLEEGLEGGGDDEDAFSAVVGFLECRIETGGQGSCLGADAVGGLPTGVNDAHALGQEGLGRGDLFGDVSGSVAQSCIEVVADGQFGVGAGSPVHGEADFECGQYVGHDAKTVGGPGVGGDHSIHEALGHSLLSPRFPGASADCSPFRAVVVRRRGRLARIVRRSHRPHRKRTTQHLGVHG